jgi:hypothetical protein
MDEISFTVYGSPVAQPRARSRPFMTNDGRMAARAYEPQTVKNRDTGIRKVNPIYAWKQDVKQAAFEALGVGGVLHGYRGMWDGPVAMGLTIYFPRPGKFMRKKDPDGPIPHIAKPDRDNVEKAILDALKGIIFVDDCQVCAGEVRKFYHEKNGRPRAEIRLQKLNGVS